MTTELFSNNAQTYVNVLGGIDAIQTFIPVKSSSLFPSASGQFRIRIDDELLIVTSVNGNIFNVLRGQENTASSAHTYGSLVTLILTAGSINNISGTSGPTGPTGPAGSGYLPSVTSVDGGGPAFIYLAQINNSFVELEIDGGTP